MGKRIFQFGTVLALTLGVVSCSGFRREERAAWRGEAERACLKSGTVRETPYVRIAKALEGPGTCGADFPLKVRAFGMDMTASAPGTAGGSIAAGSFLTALNREETMVCPMVAAVDDWLEKVVQPAAMSRFGQPVVEVRSMGTYSCRPMNNQRGNRLSEHSFANAIDVGGFKLADGRIVTVLKGWKGAEDEAYFLREVHAGACRHFSTVLGPGADMFHYDHLHMDLARHGRAANRSVCRPYPQAVPPPAPRQDPFDPALRESRDLVARNDLPDGTLPPAPAMSPRATGAPGADLMAGGLRPPAPVGMGSMAAPRPDLPPPPRLPQAAPSASASGRPMQLYTPGNGPYIPMKDEEIDPEEFDLTTGSIGD